MLFWKIIWKQKKNVLLSCCFFQNSNNLSCSPDNFRICKEWKSLSYFPYFLNISKILLCWSSTEFRKHKKIVLLSAWYFPKFEKTCPAILQMNSENKKTCLAVLLGFPKNTNKCPAVLVLSLVSKKQNKSALLSCPVSVF